MVCPSGQLAGVQTPLRQNELAVQTLAHDPQLLGSFWLSTHLPLHMISPLPQVATH